MRSIFTFKRSGEEFEKGVLFMLLSSAMLSFFTLFAKFASGELPYFLVTFLRFAVPLLLLLPYLLWSTRIKDLFFTSSLKLQLMRTGCILIYQYSIFYYLLNSTLLNATVLQNTAPLFMPILERIFFGIRFHWKVVLSIVISFAGVLCILQPDIGFIASLSIAGILAPLGQAGSQVLYGHQARSESQKSSLFYLFLLSSAASGAVYLISLWFQGIDSSWKFSKLFTWFRGHHSTMFITVNLIFLGIVSILNQTLRGMAYRHAKASALAPFLYVSLLISGVLDWAFFDLLPNWLSLAGAVLVVTGGMIQLYKKK